MSDLLSVTRLIEVLQTTKNPKLRAQLEELLNLVIDKEIEERQKKPKKKGGA